MKKILCLIIVLVWICVGVWVYIDKKSDTENKHLPEPLQTMIDEHNGKYTIKDELYMDKDGVLHVSQSCPEYKERDYDIPIEMTDARMLKQVCCECADAEIQAELLKVCYANDPEGTELYINLDID